MLSIGIFYSIFLLVRLFQNLFENVILKYFKIIAIFNNYNIFLLKKLLFYF